MSRYALPLTIVAAVLLTPVLFGRSTHSSERAWKPPERTRAQGYTIPKAHPVDGADGRANDPTRETLWYGIDLIHPERTPHTVEREDDIDTSSVSMDGIHVGRLPGPARPENMRYLFRPRAGWSYVAQSPQSRVVSDRWTTSATFFSAELPTEAQARSAALDLSSAVAARYGMAVDAGPRKAVNYVSFNLRSIDARDGHRIRSNVVEMIMVTQVAERLTLGIVLRRQPRGE